MKIAYNNIVERNDKVVSVAFFPRLLGNHTQAKSLDTLTERVGEAIDLCLEEQGAPVQSRDLSEAGG
jgi:predicted RNase H-like HicB family nuclease